MKRFSSAFLVILLCVAILGGNVSASASTAPVHLTWLYFGSEDEAKQWANTAATFTQKTEGRIEVEYITCASDAYTEKLMTMIASGESPDTFFTRNDQTKLLYEQGKLLNLKPLLEEAGLDPEKVFYNFDQANKLFKIDGGLYGVTDGDNPMVLYFNADLMEKAGVENPYQQYKEGRWTWDAFVEACDKVNALSTDSAKYFSYVFQGWNYNSWTAANGIRYYFVDGKPTFSTNPAIKETADWLVKEINDGSIYSSATTGKGIDGSQLFMSGQIGFYDAGRWMVPTFKHVTGFTWDVVPFPKGPSATEHLSYTPGYTAFAISADTKHPKEALEWFLWFVGPEGNFANYGNGGNCVPMAYGSEYMVLSDESIYAHPQVFLDSMKTSVWPDFEMGYEPKLYRFVNNRWTDLVSGVDTPDSILANLDSMISSGDYEFEE